MTIFFHVFLLTSSLYSVYCYDARSIQALLARIDALEETADIQKEQIQSQTESIQILRNKDEKQQRRIEELEKIVQVQQKVINDVIPRAKEEESQEETPEVALESTIKDEIKTVTEPVYGSGKNISLISVPSRRSPRQTPETVAFHATIDPQTHVTQLTQGQTVVFDSVHLNVGGGYHSSAGLFIAPAPGIYLFSVSVMLNTGTASWTSLELIKNGAVLSEAYAFQYDQGSVSVVTQLKIGDEVLVKVHASNVGMVYGDKLTSFMGALLVHL